MTGSLAKWFSRATLARPRPGSGPARRSRKAEALDVPAGSGVVCALVEVQQQQDYDLQTCSTLTRREEARRQRVKPTAAAAAGRNPDGPCASSNPSSAGLVSGTGLGQLHQGSGCGRSHPCDGVSARAGNDRQGLTKPVPTTLAAISRTRHASSPRAASNDGRAPSSQTHSRPRAAQTRSQYGGPPRSPLTDQECGWPTERNDQLGVSLPASQQRDAAAPSRDARTVPRCSAGVSVVMTTPRSSLGVRPPCRTH